MKQTHATIVKGCLAIAAVWAAAGCPDFKIEDFRPTAITRIAAYNCIVVTTEPCVGRGTAIPAGQIPPRDKSFQVWVWHPGYNTTSWRVVWGSGISENLLRVGEESAYTSVLLAVAAPDTVKQLWVRAAIIGVTGTDTMALARDSIGWTFP